MQYQVNDNGGGSAHGGSEAVTQLVSESGDEKVLDMKAVIQLAMAYTAEGEEKFGRAYSEVVQVITMAEGCVLPYLIESEGRAGTTRAIVMGDLPLTLEGMERARYNDRIQGRSMGADARKDLLKEYLAERLRYMETPPAKEIFLPKSDTNRQTVERLLLTGHGPGDRYDQLLTSMCNELGLKGDARMDFVESHSNTGDVLYLVEQGKLSLEDGQALLMRTFANEVIRQTRPPAVVVNLEELVEKIKDPADSGLLSDSDPVTACRAVLSILRDRIKDATDVLDSYPLKREEVFPLAK